MDALYPLRPGEQDCRDFLRTGRCKYGESCKYNHPLNVESGGGLTDGGPLPSRPGEPLCHYFLKHGICKFGQACKFDHPSGPHVEKGLGASNNIGGGGGAGGTGNGRAAASSGGLVYVTDPATGTTSVQVLPQRPNEPDCIYFLRNGRCKYGSICKFHHPLSGPSQNTTIRQPAPNTRPPPQVVQKGGVTYTLAPQTVTYVQQSPQRLQPIREQIQPQQQATHVLLPDGQIAVILNSQSLQDVRELSAHERPQFYLSQANGTVGSLPSVEQNRKPSSNVQIHSPVLTATTSASSSNNTVGSNFDLWGTTVRVPHKSNSGGSLSIESGPQGQGEFMHQSQSQASFRTSTSSPEEFLHAQQSDSVRDSMRSRATSFGSAAAEPTQGYYWPSNGSMASAQAEQGPPPQYVTGIRSAPGSGGAMYRSASYDFNRSSSSSAPPTGNGHQHASSNSDEGLSMMTASLLTMIDRPTDGDITPNTTNSSYLRPPPGMMMNQMGPSQLDNPPGSSADSNYFMGGYDQTPRF
eukprot:scaffold6887_cov102-Skeletonema_dohrnii-CCMP3373.AAC.1